MESLVTIIIFALLASDDGIRSVSSYLQGAESDRCSCRAGRTADPANASFA